MSEYDEYNEFFAKIGLPTTQEAAIELLCDSLVGFHNALINRGMNDEQAMTLTVVFFQEQLRKE